MNKPTNIKQKILYYGGEILIIVLGIFIAVQINNWNDNRKQKAEEQEALKLIANDLSVEQMMIEYYLDEIKAGKAFLERFIEEQDEMANLDSIRYYLTCGYIHQRSNAAYINLKSSGKLNIISNPKIKQHIIVLYEAFYDGNQYMAKNSQDFIDKELVPYFLRNFTSTADELIDIDEVRQVIDDRIFRNYVFQQNTTYKQLIDHLEKIDQFAETTLTLIKKYLELETKQAEKSGTNK